MNLCKITKDDIISSFMTCIGGHHLNENGTIDVPMFTVTNLNEAVFFALVLSWCCNIVSISTMLLRTRTQRFWYSNDWMFWCIFLWQCTNTYILTYIVFYGITKRLLFIFVFHTYLEWFISILYSYHNNNTFETFTQYIENQSWVTAFVITIVSALSTSHCIQILYDEDLLKIAWTARFGYILDIVGFTSSLWFSIKRQDKLAVWCFGAFGGHLFAIVGTFVICMFGYNVSIILMLTSCLQNISSTLALRCL